MKTPIRLILLVGLVFLISYLLISNISPSMSHGSYDGPAIPQSRIPIPNAEAKEIAQARQQAAGKSDKLPAEVVRAIENERPDQKQLMKGNVQPFMAAAKTTATTGTATGTSAATTVTGIPTGVAGAYSNKSAIVQASLPAWAMSLAHETELFAAAASSTAAGGKTTVNGTVVGATSTPKPLPIDLDMEERLPGFVTSTRAARVVKSTAL